MSDVGLARLPVGDLFAPFWTLEFYPNETSLLNAKDTIARLSRITNEAVRLPDSFGNATNIDEALGTQRDGHLVKTSEQARLDSPLGNLQSYKSELTVTLQGAAALFELSLTPPFDDALQILDQRVLTRSIYIVAEWGYVDRFGNSSISSGKYVFHANRPAMNFSEREITITLSGNDIMTYASMRSEKKRKWSRKEFPTDAKILQELAKEAKMELNLKCVPESLDDGRAKTLHPLFLRNKQPEELEQHLTDWMFFKKLVRDNGCNLIVGKEKTVYVYDIDYSWRALRTHYHLIAYKQPRSSEEGSFDVPIKTFSTQINPGIFAPVTSQSINYRQASLSKGKVDKSKLEAPKDHNYASAQGFSGAGNVKSNVGTKTSVGTFQQSKKSSPLGESLVTGPARDSNAKGRGRQAMAQGAALASIQASATLPGVVGLTPFQLVSVEGLGKSISGIYKVLKVVHTLGQGYSTQVDLLRLTLSKEQTQGTTRPIGPKIDEAKQRSTRPTQSPRKLEGSS